MANPIRRIVQLILDRAAAAKTERDARAALSGIDRGLSSLGETAKKVAAFLGLAFLTKKLVDFGRESVKQALESEKAWSDLGGAVRAVGGNFEEAEGRLRALGAAFQDATVHSDEEFAGSLSRLITLTGDVAAATNNMGLVANVAAAFFSGDLGPAVDLVGKVMNGNITLLQRMGIHVKTAQEGLEVLAARGFGRAEQQATTFGGKLQRLTVMWDDFKEELGGVLVSSNDASSALGILQGIVQTLTQTVKDNRDELQGGFKTALTGTIEAIDGVYRGVRGVVEVLGGALFLAIGTVLSPLVLLNKGLALLAEGAGHVTHWLGMEGATKALEDFAKRVDDLAETLRTPTSVGLEMLGEGISRFGERTQTAEDILAGIRNPGGPRKGAKLTVNPPQMGKNATPPKVELTDIDKALKDFHDSMAAAQVQAKLLGGDFDLVGAKTSALTAVLQALGQAGLDENDPRMQDFAAQLLEITHAMDGVEEHPMLKGTTLQDGLDSIAAQAEVLGRDFDAVGTEAQLLEDKLISLHENGIAAGDPRYDAYMRRLIQLRGEMKQTQNEAQLMADISQLAGQVVGASLDGGLGPFARTKAKVNLIRAAEETAEGIAAAFSLFGATAAPAHFAAAAKFVAIAGAWAAIGGGVGGGAPAGGGGGGSGLAGARGASSAASSGAASQRQDVTIVLTGPGFNALNPAVQRVVYGAMGQARERFGANANIHLRREG